MQCVTRPRITELNPHLLCVLCGGYYVDATAIIECLHSFCKSCIVRYLETHKYCPICDVLVHKTKPLQSIRPDSILQSIVYKLVPNLYEKEMCNRRKFYLQVQPQHHPENTEMKGEITESSSFFTANDTINLSLEYINFLGEQNYFYVASSSKRYLRCQAAVTIKNLRKLIAAKFALATKHEIRFFFNGIQLPEHLTLLDIAYISSWKRIGFIRLLYQILEVRKTVIKIENKESPAILKKENFSTNQLPLNANNLVNNMNTSIDQTKESNGVNIKKESLSEPIFKTEKSAPVYIAPATAAITMTTSTSISPIVTACETNTTIKINENSTLNKIVQILEKKASNEALNLQKNEKKDNKPEKRVENSENNNEKKDIDIKNGSREVDDKEESELKKKRSDNCPVPVKMLKLNAENIKSNNVCNDSKNSVANTSVITTTTNSIMNNAITPVFSYSSNKTSKNNSTNYSKINSEPKSYKAIVPTENKPNVLPQIIKKPTKTLKTFTRPWNSSAPTTVTPVKPVNSDNKIANQKPVKFFKARNTPRFLGNPASGIRPIYQVSPEKNDSDNYKKPKSGSVLKIDPQKLCPITSSVSTSSVSGASKKPFSYMSSIKYPTSTMTYSSPSSSSSYSGSLPITSPSMACKLPQFAYPNISHNPLLNPMNPLLYSIYPGFPTADATVNGPTSLDFMKAMTAFHPSLPPAINSLFNPHHKLKPEKNQKLGKPALSPPAVQRIPASSNNTKTDSDKSAASNLSNGVMKKSKKSEIKSFAINNLIPLDEVKNVTHSCSADGVNQVCDQVFNIKKTDEVRDNSKETDGEKTDQKEVELQKNTSN